MDNTEKALDLPTRYDPQAVERDLYERWERAGCFRAVPDGRPTYSVTVPPPNITGALHLGHALNHTIMDTLGRWKRMSGFNTLILPGTDHGGISTQSVVERQVQQLEKKNRHDFGREAFTVKINEWADEYGNTILSQLQRLGCAYDWERTRYTLDPAYSDAVLTAFERLYDAGYIYLGSRIVNWCVFHQTAISDIEVNTDDEDGFIWHIRYPWADGDSNEGGIIVATTRPETLFGDVAVAANPDDPRYRPSFGRHLRLPLTDRTIPLIADSYAQMEFGTGAVKVTPAHDANDYEAGIRNHLPMPIVIGPDGKLNEHCGTYAGLDRFEARKRVLADLEEQGFLIKAVPHTKAVGRCDRCNTVIEPLLSKQWFCRQANTELIDKTIADAETGRVRFYPERYRELFVRWLQNIRDWPISRQLWWGHRFPVWRKLDGDPDEMASYVVARDRETAIAKAGMENIAQIDDVLDTWFSSALWPFATLGWPAETEDLAAYYPTDALFTAQEILYLWVARMVMTGEEFLHNRPFSDVYIHATILDEQGRRMSKSKGNGVDPVELIDLYGADALRFTLAGRAGSAQDFRVKPVRDGKQEQVELSRNFANKIWNASRFALMNLGGFVPEHTNRPQPTTLADRWILSRLQTTADAVNAGFACYNLDDACRALYDFFWDDLCDWYIEAAKPRFADNADNNGGSGGGNVRHLLWYTLERTLRLLHPVMPYLTETIWQSLPGAKDGAGVPFVMLAPFPQSGVGLPDPSAEAEWATVQEVIRAIRNLRSEQIGKPGGTVFFAPNSDAVRQTVIENAPLVQSLARVDLLSFDTAPGDALLSPTLYGDVRLPRPEVTGDELAQERKRIEGELAKVDKDLAGLLPRLSDPTFADRAPVAVVEKTRAQAATLAEKREKLTARLVELGG